MKKLALGCLVVLVLGAVAAGVAAYYIFGATIYMARQVQAFAALDKNVANTAPFTPPANGELTEDMVRRFAAVQEAMHQRMAPRFEEAKAREDEFLRRQQTEHREASASETFTVFKDVASFIIEAKNAQVDALNRVGFSLDQYYWVRGQVYSAAGLTVTEIALRNLSSAMKQGGGDIVRPVGTAGEPVPERNKELVAPYMPRMKDWAVVAFFGM